VTKIELLYAVGLYVVTESNINCFTREPTSPKYNPNNQSVFMNLQMDTF